MTSLRFHDRMSGFISTQERDYNQALIDGRHADRRLEFEAEIFVDDVDAFLDDPAHVGRLRGHVDCHELGGRLAVQDGIFNLFKAEGGERTSRMHYRLFFRDRDGRDLTLSGFKILADDPGFDVWTDTTTLFIRVLPGHVDDDAERAGGDGLAAQAVATGILRISFGTFLKLLASIRTEGESRGRREAGVARFGLLFAGELWRVYGGRPVIDGLPDFPDPDSHVDKRWDGHVPGEWHETEKLPGVWRRIVGYTAGDGMPLTLHNIRASANAQPERGPVLLLHGTGVRADLFYGAPGRASFVKALVDAGYDVWASNWRASIDLPPHPYTLDQAALFDHPAAIAYILGDTGRERLKVLAHCQGSTSFVITALSGLAPQVETVVSSAVSLHPVVTRTSRMKLTAVVPLVGVDAPYIDAQWGARPTAPLAWGVAHTARLLRRECDDPICALANYMYGSGPDVLWRHANLDDATHHWTSREFGFAPLSFMRQIRRSVLKGHLVPVERLSALPDSYVAEPPRIDAPWTFVAGTRNRLFTCESQQRTHAWFDRFEPGRHRLDLVDGYGHLDVFFARDAPQTAFPRMLAGLDRV
jgi:alpha/beta hydrolase family protein